MRHLLVLVLIIFVAVPQNFAAAGEDKQKKNQVVDQVVGDLLAAGVSAGIAMSGLVPLALAAGLLTKYVATYGVMGIRSLIEMLKSYNPTDLGEINVYFIYLTHIKRNIYQTLIDIRKAAEKSDRTGLINQEIERIMSLIKNECDTTKNGCLPTAIDPSLISYEFLNIALDAKASLEVSKYLSVNEMKDTFHYLMLLYLDVMIVEQKLVLSQQQVLRNQVVDAIDQIKGNPYLSQAEKEFQRQMVLNIALRWQLMSDQRQVILGRAIEAPLAALLSENSNLQDDIDKYQKKYRD